MNLGDQDLKKHDGYIHYFGKIVVINASYLFWLKLHFTTLIEGHKSMILPANHLFRTI